MQRHPRDHRVRCVGFGCQVAAPASGVTIDDLPPFEGEDLRDPDYRADPKRYSRAALIGVIAAREAWRTPACESANRAPV